MANTRDAALGVANEFIEQFNAQHPIGLAATLNFPHVRLANGRFATVETAADFVSLSENGRR